MIAQRSSCILCPIVQLQNCHSHRWQGSHSHRIQRICSAPRAFSIQEENRNVPRDSCLWELCLGSLSLGACDMLRGWGQCTVLQWCKNDTLFLPVAGCPYGGMGRKKFAFLSLDWAGTLPALGIQAGLKDSVVHKAFPRAVPPLTRAATVCPPLALQCWHLFQLLAVGVVGGVSDCRCVSAPSTQLNSIRLPP